MSSEAGGAKREMKPEGDNKTPLSWETVAMRGSEGLDFDKIPLERGRDKEGPLRTVPWAPPTVQDFLSLGSGTERWKLQPLPLGSFRSLERRNVPQEATGDQP